jgi:hypothetical protein
MCFLVTSFFSLFFYVFQKNPLFSLFVISFVLFFMLKLLIKLVRFFLFNNNKNFSNEQIKTKSVSTNSQK